jgi:hypothetical protein
MQAWQVEPCTYVIKYSIYGRPGISDFGFRYVVLGDGNWERGAAKSESDGKERSRH